ncbi:VCBS repeat-containing protein [Verrucomicrobia bacterium]|nr:VCBS repeat-containing protein [Verrucomicrobiota bacterium]
MKSIATSVCISLSLINEAQALSWKKHLIMEQGHCNTAVALDLNGDRNLDVIASFNGKVSLLLAPDWNTEVVLHQFKGGKGQCIHSTLIDVDQDGDLDWAGSLSNDHPFWLENPGQSEILKGAWTPRLIDPVITGIHCLTTADINNDGKEDLVINNFEPSRGLSDSIAWFSAPSNPLSATHWNRHVFAAGDARGGSHYMGVGDMDGDGWMEIAVGVKGTPFANGNWFAFWKNPGEEKTTTPWKKTMLAENQLGATNILPADVNGDGKTDWLASRGHGVGLIWFENPDWKMHDIDEEILSPHSLTVADHDQDGDIDASSCGYESEWLRWYENDGSGNFKIHTLDDAQQSYDLKSIDMDGDGDLDLLNAGRGSQNVVWYENLLR